METIYKKFKSDKNRKTVRIFIIQTTDSRLQYKKTTEE